MTSDSATQGPAAVSALRREVGKARDFEAGADDDGDTQ
jgi:hypothetical protein